MTHSPLARRLRRGLAMVAACTSLLAACGGSTSQLDPFVPARLVVFGDEYSALYDPAGLGNGRHYAINPVDATTGEVVCGTGSNLLWVQRLANHYGLVFAECSDGNQAVTARMKARYGAKAATLVQQVDDMLRDLDGSFTGDDLVTMLVGLHDVIEVYLDPNFGTEGDKVAELENRGRLVAQQVNRVAGLGAKVLISQLLDVGLTPWALSQGSGEAALLTRLSDAFNKGIRLDLLNDGRQIGLLTLDDTLRTVVRYNGKDNVSPACDDNHVEPLEVADGDGDGYVDGGGLLLNCTTATLVSDTAGAGNLWADSLHANAAVLHSQFGTVAISRASRNPFQN